MVTSWSAWYLGQYWLPWDMTSIDQKVFSRAFWCCWDCGNCWKNWWKYGQMKFVTLPLLLVWALLRSYLDCSILWRYSYSFSPVFCKFFSDSHVLSPWVYPFHLTRYLFFPCLCCKSRIFSTSYSSWPCIKVSGRGVAFWPQMVDSEYWVNLLMWKTRYSAW